MTIEAAAATVQLGHAYADALPGLVLDWEAEAAPAPSVVVLNTALAAELGIDEAWLRSPAGVAFLTGNAVPAGARPVAMGYAGHQFGGYSPRLGDGRALLLGEFVGPDGQLRDIHLKGSGRTPFSRGGDGRATLGPMLREYLVSEAMHALGIPTTRALAVVATGQPVARDRIEPGALVVRVASSHIRVGTFQYARALDSGAHLEALLTYTIARHCPDAAGAEVPALALLEHTIGVQARLVAQWMLAGFIHGVMNTDNMTISGETIDYGPCAFMDRFAPGTVFSSIDHAGRYAYANQPPIAQWNLARLAEALLPLIDEDQDRAVALATDALRTFAGQYEAAWSAGMARKLGLAAPDDELFDGLLALQTTAAADHTSTYRALATHLRGDRAPIAELFPAHAAELDAWLAAWRTALGPVADPNATADAMDAANPVYVPRNHLVGEALDAAVAGDMTAFDRLLGIVTDPFVDRPEHEDAAGPAPLGFDEGFQTFCGT